MADDEAPAPVNELDAILAIAEAADTAGRAALMAAIALGKMLEGRNPMPSIAIH